MSTRYKISRPNNATRVLDQIYGFALDAKNLYPPKPKKVAAPHLAANIQSRRLIQSRRGKSIMASMMLGAIAAANAIGRTV